MGSGPQPPGVQVHCLSWVSVHSAVLAPSQESVPPLQPLVRLEIEPSTCTQVFRLFKQEQLHYLLSLNSKKKAARFLIIRGKAIQPSHFRH